MSRNPRAILAEIPDEKIEAALGELSWKVVRGRIEQMDYCAPGGVSLDATVIAALVERLIEVQPPRPRIPGGTMTVRTARRKWEELRVAATQGDPAAMLDAAKAFQPIAELALMTWENE
jgi:hypothetical protein